MVATDSYALKLGVFQKPVSSPEISYKTYCIRFTAFVGGIFTYTLANMYYNNRSKFYHDPTTFGLFVTCVVIDIVIFIRCCRQTPLQQVSYELITGAEKA